MRFFATLRMTIAVMILAGGIASAVTYPVISIVDTERHKLVINSDGTLTLKFTGGTATVPVQGYPTFTPIDTDGNKIDIGSDGTMVLKGE